MSALDSAGASDVGRGDGRIVVVTGASGFVGKNLVDHLLTQGYRVRALVRHPEAQPLPRAGLEYRRCDLPDAIDESSFQGAWAVVHAAYTSRFTTLEEARRTNEEGSARVLALARAAGVPRFAFISSTSAHDEARNDYGRSKLAVERTLDPARDLIIRPGLVLGDGGLFQRLSRSLGRFGVVPLFDGGRQVVQTVWIGDLCESIERALARGLTGRYVVAEPVGLSMRDLFRLIAAHVGSRVFFVPLPASLLVAALRFTERLRLPLPISSENVLGATAIQHQPSAADLDAIGVWARPAAETLKLLSRPASSPG